MKAWMKGGLIGGVFGLFLGLIFSFVLTGSYLVITISFLIISSVIGAILFGLLNIPKWMKHGLIGMFFLIPVSYIIWGFFDGGFLQDFCREIWDNYDNPCKLFKGDMIPVPTILGWISILILGFVMGVIISWIIGKIKSR